MTRSKSFSFLVTTDNHLGYKQDDLLRRKDSFMAFAEALQVAREKNVDFILLGGDLFHVNRPSSAIEHKCIKIIRQHMSDDADRGASFKRISGDFSHFERVKHANFEDPNLKVPYPIMTIHGNHDDPTGPNAKSVCEKLATCGLLNYFGAFKLQTKDIEIAPIIFEKDGIKIALYGMGFVPDIKLRASFDRNEIRFVAPPLDTFNILVVHQNRVPHVKSKYIPDEYYPKFIHLLIRGHEHDTLIPTRWPESEVDGLVYQPGSTVATSISSQESAPKKVAVMSVKMNDPEGDQVTRYKLDYELIPLKCARKIILKDISQREIFDHIKSTDQRRKLTPIEYRSIYRNYVKQCIENLLKDCEISNSSEVSKQADDVPSNCDQNEVSETQTNGSDVYQENSKTSVYNKLNRFEKPLVKIRLEYKNKAERFDDIELNSRFYPHLVANRDIIIFRKQKLIETEDGRSENVTFSEANNDDDDDEQDEFDVINLSEERRDTIETMIESYFLDKPASESLIALSLSEYTNAVRGACEDGNVISKVLAKKKMTILRRYKEAIADEEVAEKKFNDEERVQKWFMDAFKSASSDASDGQKLGGDEDEVDVIMLDE